MIFFLTAIIIVLLDQLTKLVVQKFLELGKQTAIIPNFLYIKYLQNTGMGFGLMQGQTWMIAWITIIFIGILLYYYDKMPGKKIIVVFAGLLLGGAVGNLIDRIAFGFVRDFIAFTFWPAFNIADMAITVGGIGLLVYLWRKKE